MTDATVAAIEPEPGPDAPETPAAVVSRWDRLRARRYVNPVLAREMQSRMRSWRAPVILTVWLLITAGILWLVRTANDASSSDPFGDPLGNADLGRGVFDWVLFVMMAVLFFLIPGQAAGAIAGERERQTLIPLQVTLLTTRQLLFGKILASSAFLLLLMVAAMPILAIAYLIGGVRISEILVGMLAVVATGVLLATMATAVSALTRRVQAAVVLSYLLALALAIGPFIGYGVASIIDSARGTDATDPPKFLLVPDPFVGVADIAGDRFSGSVPSPWDGLYTLMHDDPFESVMVDQGFEEGFGVVEDVVIADDIGPTTTMTMPEDDSTVPLVPETTATAEAIPLPLEPGVPPPPMVLEPTPPILQEPLGGDEGPAVPYWLQSLTMQAALAGALLFLAARRLRTPAEVER